MVSEFQLQTVKTFQSCRCSFCPMVSILSSSNRQRFARYRTFFKVSTFDDDRKKFQKFHTYMYSLYMGSKLNLCSLQRQHFTKYGMYVDLLLG